MVFVVSLEEVSLLTCTALECIQCSSLHLSLELPYFIVLPKREYIYAVRLVGCCLEVLSLRF